MKRLSAAIVVCLLCGLCATALGASYKGPTPYAPDANTVALWRFDEELDKPHDPLGFVFSDSSGNGWGLKETSATSTVQLFTVPGAMGRAVTGFTNTSVVLRNNSIPAPAAHTLEAWLKWDNAYLPQNHSSSQLLFRRNAGSSYPKSADDYQITFRRDSTTGGGYLNIWMMTRRELTGTGTAHYYINENFRVDLGDMLEADTWYHFAVSVETGMDLNGVHLPGSSGDDVRIRVFLSDPTMDNQSPDPFAEFVVYDTGDSVRLGGVRAPQWTFNIGNYYAPFRGYIDEMRFSNVARTEFATIGIPEPATLTMLGLGLAGLIARRRR